MDSMELGLKEIIKKITFMAIRSVFFRSLFLFFLFQQNCRRYDVCYLNKKVENVHVYLEIDSSSPLPSTSLSFLSRMIIFKRFIEERDREGERCREK
jgi:hypothetical protein